MELGARRAGPPLSLYDLESGTPHGPSGSEGMDLVLVPGGRDHHGSARKPPQLLQNCKNFRMVYGSMPLLPGPLMSSSQLRFLKCDLI